jgi:Peptidase S46
VYIYFRKSKKNMAETPKYTHLLTKGLLCFLALLEPSVSHAKEGMWIPATLKQHEKDMKAMGLQIPVDRLYNENGTGLNNAVVLFGRGCTGELISSKGLVLTNHHCGYGSVQGLSSTDKDYFANGFFAQNQKEEIPCPGLTVTFIRRMENVTSRILENINDTLNDKVRDSIVAIRILAVEKEFMAKTRMEALIKPYFNGNQYWVAIMETYKDIRLVGFPPNGIGAFGGDVENWMWPRHTGDFSMFRVYAGADNKPADYAAANQPYRTEQYFNINISGYKEGDFTMVYGFPGTTQEYISSHELKQVYSITDPISIAARTRKLDVWTKHMSASRDIFLKYTSKRAGVANGWKKWQGEVLGLKVNNATGKKQAYERTFQLWAAKDNTLTYADNILPQIAQLAGTVDPLIYLEQFNREAAMGVELIQQGASAEKLLACFRKHTPDEALGDSLRKTITGMAGFYKNYDAATDKDVFITLMILYFEKCPETVPEYFKSEYRAHNLDLKAWAEDIYNRSLLTSQEKLNTFAGSAKAGDSAKILTDPAWLLYSAVGALRKEKISAPLKDYYSQMRYLNRLYMKAQMTEYKNKIFYPDANLTLRVTYGQVKGLDPEGPPKYSFQTTLKDCIALDDSTSDIFRVPKKLKELYAKKDYGRWGVNGSLPLAFTASNHTSGGNSGSPVLNAKGELIGTNFDRAYEGTMSDYYFDPNRCRNISVDIRYTLFIVEKFGGAGWLIDEMKLVKK